MECGFRGGFGCSPDRHYCIAMAKRMVRGMDKGGRGCDLWLGSEMEGKSGGERGAEAVRECEWRMKGGRQGGREGGR